MKICNLASGSTGNCTYVETNSHKCLIDIGKNKKYIVEKLNEIGVDYKDIEYIFLTHTHDDHISAMKTFLKNHTAKIVLTNKMLLEISDIKDLNIVTYDDDPFIEGIEIKSFKMSHDVADIRSFIITENNSSFAYITDTGYIKEKYFKDFKDREAYFIESNHDIEMLTHGPYPDFLKQRVLSDEGHLSNKFAGIYLSKFVTDKTQEIVLLHLSEKNNTENLALDTVKSALEKLNVKYNITCAKPSKITGIIEI